MVFSSNLGGSQPGGSGGGGGSSELHTTTIITAAQFRSLFSSPQNVTPVPAAGKQISVTQFTGQYVHGTSTFSNLGLVLAYANAPTLDILGNQVTFSPPPGDDCTLLLGPYVGGNVLSGNFGGQRLVLSSTSNLGNYGPISSSSLNSGGSGWAINDTFTVDGITSSATGVVDTVDGGGAILTYHLDALGNSYKTAIGVGISATIGVGVDATLDLTVTVPGTGHMQIDVFYNLVDVAA